MNNDGKLLDVTIRRALTGEGAHVEAEHAFAGLEWRMAGLRPDKAIHSIYQLLNHLIYWQEWAIKWLKGKRPPIPKHASGSWPGAASPATREEWDEAVRRFRKGLEELGRLSKGTDLLLKKGGKSPLEMLHTIASHNSYHIGQIVVLRQMLSSWPPPSGGLTW